MHRRSLAILAASLLLAVPCARAQSAVPTTTTLEVDSGGTEADGEYGNPPYLRATVTWSGEPCPGPGQSEPEMTGTLTLERDGVIVEKGIRFSLVRTCANGVHTSFQRFSDLAEPGDYRYTVEYTGEPGLAGSRSGSAHVQIHPTVQEATTTGAGSIGIGAQALGSWSCLGGYGIASSGVPSPPAGIAFPYGFVSYRFTCNYECWTLCPPGAPYGTHPEVRMLADAPSLLPPSASVWAYTSGTDSGPPTWQQVPGQVYAGRGAFTVSGPGSAIYSQLVEGIAGIGVPERAPNVQDMWWAGQAENGWGIAISQDGDELFAGFFIYDDSGKPQWVVMPGGTWDATHSSFSGDVYRPSGSWFADYRASRFAVGSPVGAAKISFADDSSGALDLTLDGRSVHKAISRLPYAAAIQGAHAGLWWGGMEENGWGLAISQQDRTLFVAWFTYDAQGKNVWYVMPGGAWTADNVYTGTLYRTQGSGWLEGYEASGFEATPVGTLRLSFSGLDKANMTYAVDGVTGTEILVRQPF